MKNEELYKIQTTEKEVNSDNEKQDKKLKVHSRKERKKRRAQELAVETGEDKELETLPKKTLWVQLRILPIWLRVILVILLLTAVIIIGLRFGYGFIGDGNPADVLKKETWTHILDIINGKE